MSIWQAIILSVVEGLTEFLPISSTGHLILISDFLNVSQTNFVKSFEVAIQLGAISAVAGMFWRRLGDIKILIAFMPAAVVGFIAYPFIKQSLLGNTAVVLWTLFIGGLILLFIDKIPFGTRALNNRSAFLVGLFQALSIVPGVSRAAATIIGGLIAGMDRKAAVEFSFLLAVPTMFAATGFDLINTGWSFTSNEWLLLGTGFAGSLVTALLAVKFMLQFIKSHTFFWFGVYRITLAGIFLLTH